MNMNAQEFAELESEIEIGVLRIIAKYGKSYLRHMIAQVSRKPNVDGIVYTIFLSIAREHISNED